MKIKRLNITPLILLGLFIFSCKKDKDDNAFKHTSISKDISTLYESYGDTNSDTVWVYVQGGPVTQREYPFEETYQDGDLIYADFNDDLRIYPYQAQHLNPNIAITKTFNFNDAKVESGITSEIVKTIVEHFNQEDKVVYLIGHSFGSFVVNDVLAKYGSIARKTISLNGRLDMDDVVWQGFSKGEEWLFNQEGINPTLNHSASNSIEENNMRKLAAGLGYNRYSQKLANTDLSDALFLTAEDDEFVGDFTQQSIDFLNSKAEKLFVVPNFGHSDVFNPDFMKELHHLIIQDN